MYPIEARQLTRMMNGRTILDGVDLAVATGETVALLGSNGAGKTTLLRCLAGALPPTSGEVRWFGKSPGRRPVDHRLTGFAGHESFLYLEMSSRENLLFAARMHAMPRPREQVERLLRHCQLQRRAEQPAGQLSKGLRQRLSIARALVHDPPIVILDEPFTGLDAEGRDWLADVLRQLRSRGCAICLTGHDEQLCRRVSDRQYEVRAGRLAISSAICPLVVEPVPLPLAPSLGR